MRLGMVPPRKWKKLWRRGGSIWPGSKPRLRRRNRWLVRRKCAIYFSTKFGTPPANAAVTTLEKKEHSDDRNRGCQARQEIIRSTQTQFSRFGAAGLVRLIQQLHCAPAAH